MTKLWYDDVPTLVRDCYYPRIRRYYYILNYNPVPPFDCSLDPSPSPSVSQISLQFATLSLICTVLCNQFSSLIPVLDRLYKQVLIPAGLHRPSYTCCLANISAPQVPAGPCSPAPRACFFRLDPRPVIPPSLPSTWFKRPFQPLWVLSSGLPPSSAIYRTITPPCRPCFVVYLKQDDKFIAPTTFAGSIVLGDIIKMLVSSNFMGMVISVSAIFDTEAN